MANKGKPKRGERAKTNEKTKAKRSGSTVHRINHGKGPKVIGSPKPPRNLQRLRAAAKKDK